MQFLKNILSSFIGTLIAFVIAIFIFIGALTAMFISVLDSSGSSEVQELTEGSILRLKLNKNMSELGEENPFEGIDLPFRLASGKIGLLNLIDKVNSAATDVNIKGVYLELSHVPMGYAGITELRDALIRFKESGKPIIAYGEVFTERTYYLASVADKVFLNPAGLMEFKGFSGSIMFYKGMFEKLGVEPKIFRVGKYKSAVEPFLRKDMSEANKEQYRTFLESIYDYNLGVIAESRQIPEEELRTISDNLLIQTPEDAVKYGLVDATQYYDQVESVLKETMGFEKELKFVGYNSYDAKPKSSSNKIAVVVADGDIMSGTSNDGVIGSADFVSDLKKARKDEDVKAIIIRINSPGGSAMASDVMWREIQVTAQEKPVIASMSNMAASGGYYMAMGCDKIVAHENTITGSIGVFGMLFNLDQFMEDKLGLTFDRVNTGEFSDIGSLTRPMTKEDSMIIQHSVNRIYEDFTKKAAEGRAMSHDDLKEIAQGRVWSGTDAKRIGLVDEFGGLLKAGEIAAAEAEIEKYTFDYYPKEKNFLEKLEASYQSKQIENVLENKFPVFKQMEKLNNMQGLQTRIPFDINLD